MQDKAIAPLPAPFLARIAAMIYESLLVTAVVFVASFIIIPVIGEMHAPWQRHLFQAYILGVLFAYFSAFWLRSGQTLAMKTWRIRLVNADGGPLTFKQALLRFFLALLGLLLAGAGFWWALFDRDRQFLHDRIVGTRLVRVPRKVDP
ncbi:MAG: RDD family protein [Thiobacillus sp.]|nr:RDD family protein [Thiobacillus sp.]